MKFLGQLRIGTVICVTQADGRKCNAVVLDTDKKEQFVALRWMDMGSINIGCPNFSYTTTIGETNSIGQFFEIIKERTDL